MSDMKSYIEIVADGRPLTHEEAHGAFDIIMSGEATPAQIGGFLMALRVRGETVEEISGAVASMRQRMTKVMAPDAAIDIVGTGGDASGTYNISTCAALVTAGAGIPVAKHGNRALTSKSGAADTLAELGINLEIGPDLISRCISEAGIGFMFAPAHHPAMRHVGPSRVELGTRTIFNLLGPLSNPASVKRYMLGVFDARWVEPLANVLQSLGAEAVWVVNGEFGPEGSLDEISTVGETHVAELREGSVRTFVVQPEDFGVSATTPDRLVGGTATENAEALREVLDGSASPYRDCVIANAGAALIVAGRAETPAEAATLAAESIDSGAAHRALDRLVAVSNGR